MDVRELRMFVAVAEEGSIRAGARRVLIAQPHLSQSLRRLERELGSELFVRSRQGVSLTAAGEALLADARDIIARLDRAVRSTQATSVDQQKVRIGLMAGHVAAAELTGPIMKTFRDAYPHLDVEVHELSFLDQFDAVTHGHVDVALVRPPAFDPGVTVDPLFDEPRVLCMGNLHDLSDASSLAAADFIDERFIDLVKPRRQWADFWQLNDVRQEPARTHPATAVTLSELQVTLLCEDVVVTAASSAWRLGLSHPMLTAVPIEDVLPSTVAVAYRDGDDRPGIHAFAKCARAVCAELIHLVPDGRLSA